ncbi:MAG: YitT family protein [Oscillospiraceae bacterium]|nr:YitT family protein [Oscillospiraceae bacterium]
MYSKKQHDSAHISEYLLIILYSLLYAISTLLFVFPHRLLLGGTSGISVILESVTHMTPGSMLMAINTALIAVAFFLLGKEMGIKTLIGSLATSTFIGVLEPLLTFEKAVIPNLFVSAAVGAGLIAVASSGLFYIKSSSGGTDVLALILKKYTGIQAGRALLITDILIVIFGGLLADNVLFLSSLLGLLIKTTGIDVMTSVIQKHPIHKQHKLRPFRSRTAV